MRKPQPKQQRSQEKYRKAKRVPAIEIPRQMYFQFERLADVGLMPQRYLEHLQPVSARRVQRKKRTA